MKKDSVVMVDLAKDPKPTPEKYGVKDWWHNKYGEISYAYFYDSREQKKSDKPFICESRENQRWKQDNEDHMEEYFREGWNENERISLRNDYAYFCGGWDYNPID